jgi:SAM-dependent methyltransferase
MSVESWDTYWSDRENWDWWKKPAPEVLDYIRSLSPVKRPKVLDLGSGLGRHAIAFALAGFEVTAADASSSAIQHLTGWAEELHLSINTHVGDIFSSPLPGSPFDIVVSYNVIYHGSREQFARAIQHTRRLLKSNGEFFFTCPSRNDGKYGFGEEVAPHTFRCTKSVIPGDIHYFADECDLAELLTGFKTLALWKSEGHWDNNGKQQFSSNWHVCAEKI